VGTRRRRETERAAQPRWSVAVPHASCSFGQETSTAQMPRTSFTLTVVSVGALNGVGGSIVGSWLIG